MSIAKSLAGTVCIEIISGDISRLIDQICREDIPLWDVSYLNDLTVQFRLSRFNLPKLSALLNRRGEQWKILSRDGLYWRIRTFLVRPIMTAGLLSFLFLAVFLPGRVFFVRVDGNQFVCTNQILEKASALGIDFGASRRLVRSEQVKNGLLNAIEALEWVGINTKGCVATISVREHPPEKADPLPQGIGNVVALRDGVILSCDVIRGGALCTPGQAVKSGETLITGTVDHGFAVTSTVAGGEVFAATERQIHVRTPAKMHARGLQQRQTVNFSLLLGKKLINFFKGSGISGGTCVKMYSKYVLTLPGGFSLPVALIKQTTFFHELDDISIDRASSGQLLSDFSYQYLSEQMIAGKVLIADQQINLSGDAYQLTGRYACTEMIGRLQQEQIGAYNGKTD